MISSRADNNKCVLFATMEFHPVAPGGAGILVRHTVEMLLERGYKVVLLFDAGRAAFDQLINVERLKIPFGHRLSAYLVEDLCDDLTFTPEVYPHITVEKSIRLDHALRKVTAMHEIDLIELYDYCGHGFHYLSQCAPGSGPPVAVRLHSTLELIDRKTRAPLAPERLWLYAMERAQLMLADVILSPGAEYYRQDVMPLYPSLPAARVEVSPPVHRPIGQVEYDSGARDVAFYGRLSTLKGLDTFLRAAVLALDDPLFSEWLGRFVIIGPEDNVATALTLDELRGLIPEPKADRFQFMGRLDHADLLKYLGKVAFACFGNRVESFCYAAHELQTAGVPLIVNRIPAFEDGFEDGVSAIFFDGTALGLAAGMKSLAQDAALRMRLSRFGKGRSPSYWSDHYAAHLSRVRPQPAEAEPDTSPGSVFILCTDDHEAADRTAATLSSSSLQLLRLVLDPSGEVMFGGSRWRIFQASGETVSEGKPVGKVCLFVRAGDLIDPAWLEQALRLVAHNERIGAVGGWLQKPHGIEVAPYLYMPELAGIDEPGLRVVLRVDGRQILGEYLHGWSNQSERSHLLEHRAVGRAIVELPRLAVDARGAINLPAVPKAATSVDFDRFSREFLVFMGEAKQDELPSNSRLDPEAGDPELLATTVTPTLVVIRKAAGSAGELWVLRILHDDHFIERDWSAAITDADWVRSIGPDAPAGVMATNTGSMRLHTRGQTGVELLHGPFCAVCEILYRGHVHRLDLRQPEIRSRAIWIDQLARSHKPTSRGRRPANVSAISLRPEHATLVDGEIALLAIGNTISSPIASLLRHRPGCRVLTADEMGLSAAGDLVDGIRYCVELIGRINCRTVAVDVGVLGGPQLAAELLQSVGGIRVVALLGETVPLGKDGAVDAYRRLGPWLRLADRYPSRVGAASTNPALSTFFSRCNVPVTEIPPRLPPILHTKPTEGMEIEVIVIPGSGTIPSSTHMVAATAHARKTGLAIKRLWLHEHDEQAQRVARSFAAAPVVEHYQSLENPLSTAEQPVIALAVFPDDDPLPVSAAFAITAGALPILGPSSVFASCAALRDCLSVTYWEDALAVADALVRTGTLFSQLIDEYEKFRLAQEQVIERGISSLLTSSQAVPLLTAA